MGKGKGDVQGYEVEVLPDKTMFEVDDVSDSVAEEALRKASAKLPLLAKVVMRI